jgi:hypothetical protein
MHGTRFRSSGASAGLSRQGPVRLRYCHQDGKMARWGGRRTRLVALAHQYSNACLAWHSLRSMTLVPLFPSDRIRVGFCLAVCDALCHSPGAVQRRQPRDDREQKKTRVVWQRCRAATASGWTSSAESVCTRHAQRAAPRNWLLLPRRKVERNKGCRSDDAVAAGLHDGGPYGLLRSLSQANMEHSMLPPKVERPLECPHLSTFEQR